MPFKIAESDSVGAIMSGTIITLSPGPAWVTYPDKFDNTVRSSKDGNAIIQTPVRDTRPRQWIWHSYKANVLNYTVMYQQLLNYHYKNRLNGGKSPWVFIYENETLNLVYKNWNGTAWVETADFMRAKVTQVTQNVLPQGGL